MEHLNPTPLTSDRQQTQAVQDHPARKPYTRPAIVSETKLETRAGSTLSLPIDPLNDRNDYGL